MIAKWMVVQMARFGLLTHHSKKWASEGGRRLTLDSGVLGGRVWYQISTSDRTHARWVGYGWVAVTSGHPYPPSFTAPAHARRTPYPPTSPSDVIYVTYITRAVALIDCAAAPTDSQSVTPGLRKKRG